MSILAGSKSSNGNVVLWCEPPSFCANIHYTLDEELSFVWNYMLFTACRRAVRVFAVCLSKKLT